MGPEDLRLRTKSFAVRVVRLYKSLPPGADAQVLGRQLLRSGTSVAANYRAACRARSRARSRAEWIAKIGVVVEEADESVFWLEMLSDCGVVVPARLKELMNEANELTALFSASRQTARKAG
jgi:four helix bundle protein